MSHSPEVEKLARTLKNSKLAVSESEAYRMAEDMLSTSKKVYDDHKDREKQFYGDHKESQEMQTAHKMMEKITQNMSSGKRDVRVDIAELDLEKPLKDLMPANEEPTEQEDDDAVLLSESTNSASQTHVESQESVIDVPEHFGKLQSNEPEKIEIADDEDDFFDDDDDDKDHEEESLKDEETVVNGEQATKVQEVEIKEIYY